jgi:hypothetical protein
LFWRHAFSSIRQFVSGRAQRGGQTLATYGAFIFYSHAKDKPIATAGSFPGGNIQLP